MAAIGRNPEGLLGSLRRPPTTLVVPSRGDPLSASFGSVDSEGSSRPALLAPESVDQLNLRTADPYRGVIAKDKFSSTASKAAVVRKQRRRRSMEVLDTMQALEGDASLRRTADGSPVPHAATLLYGRPSEMNNDPPRRTRSPDANPLAILNVQAPLHAKSRPATRAASSASVSFAPGISGLSESLDDRPRTRTADYGRNIDMRRPDVQHHLMRKERSAAAASLLMSREESDKLASTLTALSTVSGGDSVDGFASLLQPLNPSVGSPSVLAGEDGDMFDDAELGEPDAAVGAGTVSTLHKTSGSRGVLSRAGLSKLHGTECPPVDIVPLKGGSSVGLAHLNSRSRESLKMKASYLQFATHDLSVAPTAARFGMLRLGTEYCFPITVKNTGLMLRRFRVASIYLDPSKAAGRLRCRYPPLKLAPGTRADLLVVLRGDEVGTLQGTVELTTEAGAIVIPITAEVMSPMEFANAVVRFSKPAGLDDATDPVFRDFIVPCGKTHVSVVPLLPTSSPSR